MRFLSVCLIILALISVSTAAIAAEIIVTVTDDGTYEGIPQSGEKVTIVATWDAQITFTLYTDSNGEADFTSLTAGDYDVYCNNEYRTVVEASTGPGTCCVLQ